MTVVFTLENVRYAQVFAHNLFMAKCDQIDAVVFPSMALVPVCHRPHNLAFVNLATGSETYLTCYRISTIFFCALYAPSPTSLTLHSRAYRYRLQFLQVYLLSSIIFQLYCHLLE